MVRGMTMGNKTGDDESSAKVNMVKTRRNLVRCLFSTKNAGDAAEVFHPTELWKLSDTRWACRVTACSSVSYMSMTTTQVTQVCGDMGLFS